jgi:subtilisin family serine protease
MVLHLPGAPTLTDLSPEWAWAGATGRGIRVAVIDSGIEADHDALEGCVDADGGVSIHRNADGATFDRPGAHDDSFGHGTACAGIIHSLAAEARITSVKVVGEGQPGTAPAFLRGLGWAIERRFDIINVSLGTTRRDWALPFYELCDRAYFQGSLVVTAANNVAVPSFPSMFGTVISVACNLATDPFRFHFNPDPPTEFLARGIDVDVAWRRNSRAVSTGNSYAAPHLAGIAALIRSKHPDLRPFQVKTVLWATAANVRQARDGQMAGRLSRALREPMMSSTRASLALQAPGGAASPTTATPSGT